MLSNETGQHLLVPKLLGIAVAGFAIYGVVATVMLNLRIRPAASGFRNASRQRTGMGRASRISPWRTAWA